MFAEVQLLHKGAELLEEGGEQLGLAKHLLKTTGAEVLVRRPAFDPSRRYPLATGV